MPDYSTRAPGVYLEEVSGVRPISGVGTAMPAFIGLTPTGPTVPTFVANWTQFEERFGGIHEGMALGKAVYAYLANGGTGCMVVRAASGDDQGPQPASAVVPAESGDAFRVSAKQPGASGNDISVEVVEETSTAGEEGEPAGAAGTTFGVVVRGPDGAEERYESVTTGSLLSQLEASQLVSVVKPAKGRVQQPTSGTTTLSGGTEGAGITAQAFLGDERERTGLAGLVTEDEVTMVAAPDLVTALARGALDTDSVTAVQTAIIDHCEAMHDRMAIIDPPLRAPGAAADGKPMSTQECLAWRDGLPSSKFAATYYPWVTVFDPVRRTQVAEPPSAFVAGAWARNDAENGVAVAPTGRLRHALGLVSHVTDAEQGLLNPRGVNCLRVFRGSGPVIWGARTLSDDSEWRYLNVRRLFNFIEESVVEGTKFAVFAPNDRDLWARLKRSVTSFLLNLWRDGALVGVTPEEAFYVKCDAETNPKDLVDQGIVTVEIGCAPSKPAEFVIIRVRQSSEGSDVND